MNTLNYIKNINRMYVKDIQSLHFVIDLSAKYNISVIVGTESGYFPFPFIQSIFIKDTISFDSFINYLQTIVPYLVPYQGVKPLTLGEFIISYFVTKTLNKTTRYIVYMDIDSNHPNTFNVIYRPWENSDGPIISYNDKNQPIVLDEHLILEFNDLANLSSQR